MTKNKDEIAAASDNKNVRHITLDEPIQRGDNAISSITVNRPFGPALRGLSISALMNEANYDEYVKLIPRITHPTITKADIDSGALHVSDMMQIMGAISYFFIPSSARAQIAEE